LNEPKKPGPSQRPQSEMVQLTVDAAGGQTKGGKGGNFLTNTIKRFSMKP